SASLTGSPAAPTLPPGPREPGTPASWPPSTPTRRTARKHEMSAPTPIMTAGATRWWRRRPAAWVHPGFRRLALAWVFTNLADSALYLMVAVWVKELTGSDSAAAVVFVMLGVPAVAAPFLGQ